MTPYDTHAPRPRPRAAFNWPAALCALLLLAATAAAQGQALYDAPARFQLKSEVLGEERTILVRTPAGYERGDERFPVLYMTDGDAHLLHTSGTVQFLARNGRIPEMIVVGITNTDRTRDLTPTRVERLPGNPNARFPTSGGADKFLKFIETELIPHVEKQYRTQPFRVLAGHSLGGLFAVHAMVARPELFNAYIAVSPAFQWDNFEVTDRVKEFFKNRQDYNRTLYVSLGDEPGDIGEGFKLFRDLLSKQQAKGFVWQAAEMADEDHGSVVLRSHYEGLRKVYDGWRLPRNPGTGAIAGGFKEVIEHYRKLSARLNYEVTPPEAIVNQVGYQLMGQRQNEDALAAFKWNVEHYPKSANVYDSLAEFYERDGKLDLAAPLYAKAAALGEQNSDPNLNIYRQNRDRVAGLLKQPANAAGNK
ncbi:MAG TPA: alpha/beta hydrolase-fold protein [Pyrinomonadaceae bacterium]|nr:alpha/beta hydrolase-fold protein [Pyrinomonadaceae bacterium]